MAPRPVATPNHIPLLAVCTDCGYIGPGAANLQDESRWVAKLGVLILAGVTAGLATHAMSHNRQGPICPSCGHAGTLIPATSPTAQATFEKALQPGAAVGDFLLSRDGEIMRLRGKHLWVVLHSDALEVKPPGFAGLQPLSLGRHYRVSLGDLEYVRVIQPAFFSPSWQLEIKERGRTISFLNGLFEGRGRVEFKTDSRFDLDEFHTIIEAMLAATRRPSTPAQVNGRPQTPALPAAVPSASSATSTRPEATTATLSLADEFKKLADLRDMGILSDEQFERAKARLLGS